MANITLLRNNFSAGELGPEMEAAVEEPAYASGCRIMENFIPAKRRGFQTIPGSYYDRAAPGVARVIPWYGKNGVCAVELSNQLARFWMLDHSLSATTLALPHLQAELGAIQWKGIGKDLWLVHGNRAVTKISDSGGPPASSTPTFTGAKLFNGAGKYPSVIALNQGRLMLGATGDEPDGLFQSRAPDSSGYRLTDFTGGTNPDDAIFTYQPDGLGSTLRWVFSNRRAAAGGDGAVWMDGGGWATPANFYMDIANDNNCAAVQPAALGNGIVYIAGPTPQLRLLLYSAESGGLIDVDLSEDSDHILEPGVVEICVQKNPLQVVWCVRSDGQLVGCRVRQGPSSITYGWGRKVPADGGKVESACVLRTSSGDEVRMIVNRGGTRQQEWFQFTKDDDFSEIHYVDNGLRKTFGTPTKTITGLSHLEGKTVQAIGDGGRLPEKVVSGGQVTYSKAVSKIHIGQGYISTCLPQRPELQVNATWQGKKKRLEKATARLYRSYGGKFGRKDQAVADMNRLEYPGFTNPEPFTGDKDITVAGFVDTDGAVKIVRDEPFPLNVLGVATRIAIMET